MKKQNYKCSECGLEAVIAKEESHDLPKAECEDCGTMTMEQRCDVNHIQQEA